MTPTTERRDTPGIPDIQAATITTQTSRPGLERQRGDRKRDEQQQVDEQAAPGLREVQRQQRQHRDLQEMIGGIDLLHGAKEGVDADEHRERKRHNGERQAIADLEGPHEEDEKCQDEAARETAGRRGRSGRSRDPIPTLIVANRIGRK